MKQVLSALAALGALAAFASVASAQVPYYWCAPPAPDACGPGFYTTNWYGGVCGPNYCVRPPWQPFNGARPALGSGGAGGGGGGGGAQLIFPTHPFARSPRDFFMIEENKPYQP